MLATNIAESSITIDDVVYVVDCGKSKETSYDALNKLACLLPSWISKASAHQVSCYFLISLVNSFLCIQGLIFRSSYLIIPLFSEVPWRVTLFYPVTLFVPFCRDVVVLAVCNLEFVIDCIQN